MSTEFVTDNMITDFLEDMKSNHPDKIDIILEIEDRLIERQGLVNEADRSWH